MDAPGDSAIGGTYVGNPVAQAAALAVLDVFEDESLVERAGQIGETIRSSTYHDMLENRRDNLRRQIEGVRKITIGKEM